MMKMKNNIRILMAALAVLFASCQKEGVRTLTATFEQFDNGSKAYIDDEYYACWENNDAVAINGTTCAVTLTTGGGHANSAEITIPGTLSGENLLAFYPADKITDMSAAGGTVDFPHIQTYRVNADGKQIIDNPMAAYCPSDGEELRFHNLGALLKVTIPNNEDIKAIQVKGIENQMLCGKAQLWLNGNGEPRLSSCTDGLNSVTLRFPEAVRANGKSFYIVLPPNTDFATLTIAVLSNNGSAWATHAKTIPLGNMLTANHIAAFSYDLSHHEDYDFVSDWTIRYTATERVDPSSTDWGTFGAAEAAYNFGSAKGLIVFNDIITQIAPSAFSGRSALQSITIPASVTEIGGYAFSSCSNLTTVSLPNVTTIDGRAFSECTNLTTVSMPSVTTIGGRAFYECTNLTTISLPSVTTIGYDAFSVCTNLTTISLPNATTIGYEAFRDCTNLTTISLPSATTVGDDAFRSCISLTTVEMPNVTTIERETFRECLNLTTISLPNATAVEDGAFGLSGLTTISLPNVTTIGEEAFATCTELTTVKIPNVTTIGEYAFEGCIELTTISLPSVTTIGGFAFAHCKNLTTVSIPNATTMGMYAFWNCTSLANVYTKTAAPTTESNTFNNVPSTAVLHLPSSLSGTTWPTWPGTYAYNYGN